MRRAARLLAGAALLASLALVAAPAHAVRTCDAQALLSAAQKDKLFRFGAVIKAELERSGARVAIVARSGLDLSRFSIRYSHAGVSLKGSPETPWAVRQLYFACDEGKPLIFDQGLSAFLMGTDQPGLGYVSVLLLPPEAEVELERAALDREQALALLGANYSANAYPFALDYQNCNQWLAELLAAAWGGAAHHAAAMRPAAMPRDAAQQWLRQAGYEPSTVEAGWMAGLVSFIPWLTRRDHPAEDLDARRFRISMPASIDAFVQQRWPQAQRLEFCHDSRRVVMRRQGATPIAEGCVPEAGDSVTALD
jgi:hypothetical protein